MRIIDHFWRHRRGYGDVAICDCGSGDAAYSIWVMGNERVEASVNDWDCSCKAWRKGLGLTMSKASQALGISSKTWESWEYGSRKPVGYAKEAITSKMVKLLSQRNKSLAGGKVRENKKLKD